MNGTTQGCHVIKKERFSFSEVDHEAVKELALERMKGRGASSHGGEEGITELGYIVAAVVFIGRDAGFFDAHASHRGVSAHKVSA